MVVGNVWEGITDKEKFDALSRSGETREKCKSCVFLPDCTSFSNCPVQDAHCFETRCIKAEDAIKKMYEKYLSSDGEPETADALTDAVISD